MEFGADLESCLGACTVQRVFGIVEVFELTYHYVAEVWSFHFVSG